MLVLYSNALLQEREETSLKTVERGRERLSGDERPAGGETWTLQWRSEYLLVEVGHLSGVGRCCGETRETIRRRPARQETIRRRSERQETIRRSERPLAGRGLG